MSNVYGRQVVVPLTNKSGGGVIAGDVVVIDTTNNASFTTTTSAGATLTIGVAQETIGANAVGRILTAGYAALVNVNASVTRGHYAATHTVAKQAADAGAARVAGTFCQFLTGGTTPDAIVYAVDLAGTALTNPMSAVGDMIQGTTAGAPARLAAVATGKVLVSQGVTTAVAWGDAPFHGCRVINTAGTSISDVTLTAIPFAGAEKYDTDGWHDTVTDNTRITPTTAGYYRFGGTVGLATASATGMRLLAVRLNGSTYIALDSTAPGGGVSVEQWKSISTEYVMNGSTDYVELIYYQSSGGAVALSTNSTYGAQFYASLLGV